MNVGDRIKFQFGGKEKEGVVVKVFPKTIYLKVDFPHHPGKVVVRKLAELEGKALPKKKKAKKAKAQKEKARKKRPRRRKRKRRKKKKKKRKKNKGLLPLPGGGRIPWVRRRGALFPLPLPQVTPQKVNSQSRRDQNLGSHADQEKNKGSHRCSRSEFNDGFVKSPSAALRAWHLELFTKPSFP